MKKISWFLVILTLLFIQSGLWAEAPSPSPNIELTQTLEQAPEQSPEQSPEQAINRQLPGSSEASAESGEKEMISIYWAIPFVLILLSIAIFPLFAPHFWHKNYWKLSLFVFGLPMLIISLFFLNEHVKENTFHEIQSYISFILLLASLFTISGAILVKGTLVGKPVLNTIILAIGAVLASFMATTGASMLLIRPLIRANKHRSRKVHIIIFFIFAVSNIGGLLTPLGDPPLFLGYLKGVPFTWTFNLYAEWIFAVGIILAVFFVWDTLAYKKEVKEGLNESPNDGVKEPLKVEGLVQFIFLFGVVLSIYFQGYLSKAYPLWWPHFGPQEVAMLLMLILSLVVAGTNSQIRKDNEFSWFPIKEVATLFAGIFACMVPTLYLLDLYGPTLGVTSPTQFFWVTGVLSSFLDNAPTYLVFLELAKSLINLPAEMLTLLTPEHIHTIKIAILTQKTVPFPTELASIMDPAQFTALMAKASDSFNNILAAISCGAVFMGANSYIGNAPNFMVKAIAEEQGIKMPSFFGYMIYSVAVLVPIFILITLIFFMS